MQTWRHEADEQPFRERMRLGDQWTRYVGSRLKAERRWKVTVPDLQIRPKYQDRLAYRDHGDLILQDQHRIEVRSVGPAFRETDPSSYPYDPVLVEGVSVLDSKRDAQAYIFVSRKTGDCLGLFFQDVLPRLVLVQNVERRGTVRDWMGCPKACLQTWLATVAYLVEHCGGVECWSD